MVISKCGLKSLHIKNWRRYEEICPYSYFLIAKKIKNFYKSVNFDDSKKASEPHWFSKAKKTYIKMDVFFFGGGYNLKLYLFVKYRLRIRSVHESNWAGTWIR